MTTPETIASLQLTWQELTGQPLHPRATERIFHEYHAMGFTVEDLRCVLDYLTRCNRRQNGARFRINVIKIVGDLENFAGLLGESRAAERNRKPAPTSKEKVLAQFRPVVDGEAVFTPMPASCQKFACREHHPKLENKNGFMVCPRCGGSYGSASTTTTGTVRTIGEVMKGLA